MVAKPVGGVTSERATPASSARAPGGRATVHPATSASATNALPQRTAGPYRPAAGRASGGSRPAREEPGDEGRGGDAQRDEDRDRAERRARVAAAHRRAGESRHRPCAQPEVAALAAQRAPAVAAQQPTLGQAFAQA